MIRPTGLTVSAMMGIVLLVAVALVALCEATWLWANLALWSALLSILGCAIHGCFATGIQRASLLGYALFGGAFLFIAVAERSLGLEPTAPVKGFYKVIAKAMPPRDDPDFAAKLGIWTSNLSFSESVATVDPKQPGVTNTTTKVLSTTGTGSPYQTIGYCLATILFGILGASWAGLAARSAERKKAKVGQLSGVIGGGEITASGG